MGNARYENMVDHLESLIATGVYKSGDRIPSLREISEKYTISMGSVRRGIKLLEDKGLLEFRHGSGTYVAPRRVKSDTTDDFLKIAVFLESDRANESYCAQALTGAQEVAAAENCSLTLNFCACNKMTGEFIQRRIGDSRGMLLLGCFDSVLEKLDSMIPGVGLSMHRTYAGLLSTVELDPFTATEQACGFFRKRRIHKIRVVSHNLPVHRLRAKIFADAWQAYGSCDQIELAEYTWADCSDDGCGYLFVSGTDFQLSSHHFREQFGRNLTEERTVLSIDGKSLFVPTYQPVSTIYIDWKQAGRIAMRECLRRIQDTGSEARRIYLDCKILER